MNDLSTISEIFPVHGVSVRAFGMTDRGTRASNQDQFLIAELCKSMRVLHASLPQPKAQSAEQSGYLFIVADGMGGHLGGEHASALAVESIESFALNTLKWFFLLKGTEEQSVLKEFQAALQQADAKICREASEHAEFAGMGTTLTMAYTFGTRLFVVHAGDSRCYLLHGGQLQRLTHDHTLVEEMVSRGVLQPAEAVNHHLRHVITNALGGKAVGVTVECQRVELQADDTLLLCSDGLTGVVNDERIAAVLHAEREPKIACERLVADAKAAAGKDNITAIVARFDAISSCWRGKWQPPIHEISVHGF